MKQITRWKLRWTITKCYEGSELDSHDLEELFDILKETSGRVISQGKKN